MEAVPVQPWKVTARGVLAAFTIALRRLIWSKFMLANLGLGALPIVICAIVAITHQISGEPVDAHMLYERFLRTLFIHFIVFFLANMFGFAVIRQESEGQTLHYLLLQPTPRWALFIGRFLAYILLVASICIGSLWICYGTLSLSSVGLNATVKDLLGKGRLVILLKESGVLMLGLAAYGSIAMLMGSYFKSGMYAIILMLWEWVLPYAPLVMKKWTVLFYLQSLLPEKPLEMGKLFELLSDPAPVCQSLLTLGLIGGVAMGVALLVFHFKECQYADS